LNIIAAKQINRDRDEYRNIHSAHRGSATSNTRQRRELFSLLVRYPVTLIGKMTKLPSGD
jgi:hypothetical protein